jgi:hypothetical protein
MNLQQTVSEILGREVSLEVAKDFAHEQFGLLSTYLKTPKVLSVKNHKEFCCFGYVSEKTTHQYNLADVVVNNQNEIGVIIQLHDDGEYRTDMFGNCSEIEINPATKNQIELNRPELLNKLK